jgi:acyl-coenzyme A thioesterase PaaI-like protein
MLDYIRNSDDESIGFDGLVLRDVVNVQSNCPGHCSCELPVKRASANQLGTLHGGCAGISPETVVVLHRFASRLVLLTRLSCLSGCLS